MDYNRNQFNYDPPESTRLPVEPESDNIMPDHYRRSRLGYVTLFFLLIIWPMLSIGALEDPAKMLEDLTLAPMWAFYIMTMLMQWIIFGLVYASTWREGTFLKGIGLKKIRAIDFGWAIAFVLVSNLVLGVIAWGLAKAGMEIPGEIELLLPKSNSDRVLWIFLSFTAGFCEESIFRGYLMSRLRMYTGMKNWIVPVILSSLAFGSGHAYQGVGGLILITIYGSMFALLYFRTGTLWPAVIAHFFQDFSALFYPYQQ